MTPADAACLLELPPHASPEQIEQRFLELRTKLEDRIAKAPTPGLKSKYRESLAQVTQAYETLCLAGDAAALPLLQRPEQVAAATPEPAAPPPNGSAGRVLTHPPAAGGSRSPRAKSQKEFVIVVLLAVAMLGGGGWWVVKMRREAAEQARVEAAVKAEADRLAAAAAARASEEKAQAEARNAALQAELAEAKIKWQVFERELTTAERRLTELRSDLRSARDLAGPARAELEAEIDAQRLFVEWLQSHLLRHPAHGHIARFEALLAARALDDASAVATQLKTALASLDVDLTEQRQALLTLTARLAITSTPGQLPFELRDSYGRSRQGTTPVTLEVPLGAASVRLQRAGWADQVHDLLARRGEAAQLHVDFPSGNVRILSEPSGLRFVASNAFGFRREGETPAELSDVPAGPLHLEFKRPGWPVSVQEVTVSKDTTAEARASLLGGDVQLTTEPAGAEIWRGDERLGRSPLLLSELPPGPLTVQARLDGYFPSTTEVLVEAGAKLSPEPITLKPKPTGLVRPDEWRSPERLTMHSTMSGSHRSETVLEYDFSQPLPNGEWGRVVMRYVRQYLSLSTDAATQIRPGTTLQCDRQPDGTWARQLLSGGFGDPQHNQLLLNSFAPPIFAELGRHNVWPATEVPVGGEWDIPTNPYPFMPAASSGTARGRLLAIQRTDTEQWADIQVTYNLQTGTGVTAIHYQGVVRLRVDLKNHYVVRYEDNGRLSGAVESQYMSTTQVTVR